MKSKTLQNALSERHYQLKQIIVSQPVDSLSDAFLKRCEELLAETVSYIASMKEV